MPLRIKVDEDLPFQVAALLQEVGHQVETITGEGLGGATDAALWAAVQAEGRFLSLRTRGSLTFALTRRALTAASYFSDPRRTGSRPCWS